MLATIRKPFEGISRSIGYMTALIVGDLRSMSSHSSQPARGHYAVHCDILDIATS